MPEIGTEVEQRRLARPLAVSHTEVTEITVLGLSLASAGTRGSGEVALGPWSTEQPAAVLRAATAITAAVTAFAGPVGAGDVDRELHAAERRGAPPTARLLAEMALLDWVALRAGLPVWRLLDLPRPEPIRIAHTLSRGEAVQPGSGRPLKVKLGGRDDEAVLERLRPLAEAGVEVVVDVNRGWDEAALRRVLPLLREIPLAALEDPVADRALLALIRRELPGLPLLLDEGVRTVAAAQDAARDADGANVKLLKFGGLLRSRDALVRLAELGARRMLGCFVEPPRAIAYAGLLAGLAHWTDLDGHLFIEGGETPDELRLDADHPGLPRLRTKEGS